MTQDQDIATLSFEQALSELDDSGDAVRDRIRDAMEARNDG